MKNIGNFIRELRIAKNYSLEELSKGIMTKSFLSKVERGKSDLTSENLFKIIDRLNVTFHELNHFHSTSQDNNQADFLTEFQYARKNNNKFLMKKLAEKETELFITSRNVRHLHNSIILEQRINQIENKSFDTSKTEKIIQYLLSIDEWTYYEITVFSNSMFFFNIEQINFFSNLVLKKTEKISNYLIYKYEIHILLTNIIVNFTRKNHISYALKLIKQLENSLDNPIDYYSRIKIKFFEGVCLIKENKLNEGLLLAEKSIKILYNLDDFTNAKIYQDYLDETLKSLSLK